jgi:Leu/Phe-tRNA-protein transferase
MKQEQDLVLVPNDWLPPNALALFCQDKRTASMHSAEFYTDDLKHGGDVFYINNDGFLIHEDSQMYVMSDSSKVALCVDITHKPVLNHNLKKLYSHVMNKVCILVVQFKNNTVLEIQSIIRPCTQ